jgi:hypothetical protein
MIWWAPIHGLRRGLGWLGVRKEDFGLGNRCVCRCAEIGMIPAPHTAGWWSMTTCSRAGPCRCSWCPAIGRQRRRQGECGRCVLRGRRRGRRKWSRVSEGNKRGSPSAQQLSQLSHASLSPLTKTLLASLAVAPAVKSTAFRFSQRIIIVRARKIAKL